MQIRVGSTLRLKRKHRVGLWYVTAHRLGATNQEDLWELVPLDRRPGDPELCQVPCDILESHADVEVIDGEWFRDKFCKPKEPTQ